MIPSDCAYRLVSEDRHKAVHDVFAKIDVPYAIIKGEPLSYYAYGEFAMNLADELAFLRRQVKEQEKENRRLKEENEFLEEASARRGALRFFSLPAVGSPQKAENDVPCHKNRGRRYQGKEEV